jgi:SAM-dependent methyltransferase
MEFAAVEVERALEARLRSGAGPLGSPSLLARIAGKARGAGTDRVVDLGSGCGELLCLLGRNACGLDLCRSLLERTPGAPRIQGDVERLPLAAGRMDLATLVLVLHYVRRPAWALAEAARVLRPGGRLIVADRIASPDPALREVHDRVERLRNPSLHRILTPAEIEEGMKSAGLAVLESEPFEDAVPLEAWLAGVDRDRGLRLRKELAGLPSPDLGGLVLDPGGTIRLRMRIYVAEKPHALTACR